MGTVTAIGIAGYVVLALGLGLFILVSVKKLASHSAVVRVWKLLEIRGPATIGIAGLGFTMVVLAMFGPSLIPRPKDPPVTSNTPSAISPLLSQSPTSQPQPSWASPPAISAPESFTPLPQLLPPLGLHAAPLQAPQPAPQTVVPQAPQPAPQAVVPEAPQLPPSALPVDRKCSAIAQGGHVYTPCMILIQGTGEYYGTSTSDDPGGVVKHTLIVQQCHVDDTGCATASSTDGFETDHKYAGHGWAYKACGSARWADGQQIVFVCTYLIGYPV